MINITQRFTIIATVVIAAMLAMTACIEDGISTSAADQPTFSTDTLSLGVVFTDQPTTTHRLTVYNRHDKGINIDHIAITGDDAQYFRINVDGQSATTFDNVEIRANDSIYILVAATLPTNGEAKPRDVSAELTFTTLGDTRHVTLFATGQDVTRLHAPRITSDMHLTDDLPYQVFDSLVVDPGVTLTVDPGATIHFHDHASLIVHGTLKCQGTLDKPINITGDRTGNVITDITFDLMSRQWQGVTFTATSHDNYLSHTSIRNTVAGIKLIGDSDNPATLDAPTLTAVNSQLRNSGDLIIDSQYASIVASGCEFAEAASGIIKLLGGNYRFDQCTFANYYLFSAIGGPSLQFVDPTETPITALFTNSIIYGLSASLSHGDLTGTKITLDHCLLKEAGSDDDNFIQCLWDKDPLYYTVREDYIFDYRLKPESPAIGAGSRQLMLPMSATDAYGLPRGNTPDLGAYVFTQPQE